MTGPSGAGSGDLPDPPPGPLRLARIEQRVFGAGRPFVDADRTYFADLMASYGSTVRTDDFAAGRNTFRDMIEGLLPELGSWGDRFDLAVLAHSTPDAEPGWPMCYLGDAVSAAGLAFAISDQGYTAPFTALRLLLDSPHTYGARRVQLWTMDQTALLHDRPVPERIRPRRDCAVVLVLDEHGELGTMSATQRAGVASADVADLLRARLHEAGAPDVPVSLLVGLGLASRVDGSWPADDVRTAEPGAPCTGVWSLLAAHRPRLLATGRRVVLADYDEELGYLGTCTIDIPARRARER